MRSRALNLLRRALAQDEADFRPGQWESIDALLQNQRLLVVQRTGWGKSIVYFIATRLLRDRGAGVTLLISPLLSLMRNQILAASLLEVRAETINSSNNEDWDRIEQLLHDDELDILLISPERLANDAFRTNVLSRVADRVGLFVVDEAHCISDWGHDFRPDYRRIVRILQALPSNIPVLATTATANNRVVEDVAGQLGDLIIERGPLIRESLMLQNIWLPSPSTRMAWLAEVLPQLQGSGIVYTLTQRDAERVAEWLRVNHIQAEAYHADIENREELENRLLKNDLKVLVATVALGMGFDKPDLGFAIHFQRPGSVVYYYQQVGRAGRAVEKAYGILLSGDEDKEITDYFIRNAFPPQVHVDKILSALEEAENGLTVSMLQHQVNLKNKDIEKTLKWLELENPSPVSKQGTRWHPTPVDYKRDTERIERLCQIRRDEQEEMLEYMQTSSCLMNFLAESLDDPTSTTCGKCSNCAGKPLLQIEADSDLTNQASIFLKRSYQKIEPRKKWPAQNPFPIFGWTGIIPNDMRSEGGRALSLWGDAGWGQLVRQGKYEDGRFADELIEGCITMIKQWNPGPFPTWITCVPSLKHPELVPDFTKRLADSLGLPFIDCVRKVKNNQPQKVMENSYYQANNLDGAFEVTDEISSGPCFLVDDMVDSGWTITVIAALLLENECEAVFPLALAQNSIR